MHNSQAEKMYARLKPPHFPFTFLTVRPLDVFLLSYANNKHTNKPKKQTNERVAN